MKADKIAEAAVGAAMIFSGGIAFLPTTIPGAALVADAFDMKVLK
jgi:hypothetical protein